MKRRMVWLCAGLSAVLGMILGCGGDSQTPKPAPSKSGGAKSSAAEAPETVAGWGTIRGRVTFAGDKLPTPSPLVVEKNTEHCLAKGPLLSEKWVVNAKNRGVRYVVAYVKPPKGKTLPLHESLKQVNPPEVVIDQPNCAFEPHVVAIREGQRLLAKNPSPIAHNVMLQGLKNSFNIQIPPGHNHTFQLSTESGPIKTACGAHPWMEGYVWVLDHPYFAVTDADGNFEIKFVPAGTQSLVLWQESVNYVPDAKGRTVEVKPEGVTDLGEVPIKPAG